MTPPLWQLAYRFSRRGRAPSLIVAWWAFKIVVVVKVRILEVVNFLRCWFIRQFIRIAHDRVSSVEPIASTAGKGDIIIRGSAFLGWQIFSSVRLVSLTYAHGSGFASNRSKSRSV